MYVLERYINKDYYYYYYYYNLIKISLPEEAPLFLLYYVPASANKTRIRYDFNQAALILEPVDVINISWINQMGSKRN